MLVLTRKQGEKIRINDNIYVTVSKVGHGKVRLAFQAPSEVRIDRLEVIEKREGDPK